MMLLSVWLPGSMFLRLGGGGLFCLWSMFLLGGSVIDPPDRDLPYKVKSGRYASYRNVFLLIL